VTGDDTSIAMLKQYAEKIDQEDIDKMSADTQLLTAYREIFDESKKTSSLLSTLSLD